MTALRSTLMRKADELELSIRPARCLRNLNRIYIGDVVLMTSKELLAERNFGRKSLAELKDVLAREGLHLGMEVPDWPFPEISVG